MRKKHKKSPKQQRMTESRKMFLAFQRAISDLEQGPLPDPFKYADYDYRLNELTSHLVSHVKENEYRPNRAENFDMPKGELAIRPGAVLDIADLTVLHRLTSEFILDLDAKLSHGVVAYRLRKDKKYQYRIERESAYFVLPRYKRDRIKIEESWYNLWPQFRQQLKKDLQGGRYECVAKTDITAFFEDVNLLTLGEILKQKTGCNLRHINMIVEILRNWALRDPANVRQRRGLPQGINLSGVLSNHYLQIIDDYLDGVNKEVHQSDKIKWYRYCDDINVLCKSEGRARAVLLNLGRLLRVLGLNQNAEKTEILDCPKALDTMYYSVAENISSILEESKGKDVDRVALIIRLRHECKKLPRRDAKYEKKCETALFCAYNAARVLDSQLLIKRSIHDFKKFPVRAKSICGYVRRFINMPTIYKLFKEQLTKKHSLLLYNFQIAFLLTVFRNYKKPDRELSKYILEVAKDINRHWYVRVQAINTLFYHGIKFLKPSHLRILLSPKNHSAIRRAAIVLLPLCNSEKEIEGNLSILAKELDVTVSRMANFLLDLINSKESAIQHLKKFSKPHYIFVGDQIWRLWFIALNKDKDVQQRLRAIEENLNTEYRNYPIIKNHLREMSKLNKPVL